jgi:hypothetical protein
MIKIDRMGYVVYIPEIERDMKQYLRLGYLNDDDSFHSFDDSKRDFVFKDLSKTISRWEPYSIDKIDNRSKRRIVIFLFRDLRGLK